MRKLEAFLVTLVVLCITLVVACSSEANSLEGSSGVGGDSSNATDQKGALPEGANPEAPSNLPCDVDAILRSKCQTCHGSSPAAGASVSLVTHDDLVKDHNGKKVFELMSERIHSATSPMPPKPSSLSADELAKLDNYFKASAPVSADKCNNGTAPSSVKPLNCKPDLVVKSDKKFTMPQQSGADIYMCYGAQSLFDKKRHITAFAPHVDNPKIVHHIILFKSAVPVPNEPFACSAFGSAAWEFVSGWAPGGTNLELPPEAGYPAEAGATNWVMQIHYNNASGKFGGESDQSGFEMCSTEQLRKNDAGVVGFGTIVFAVPPRSNYAVNCAWPATPEWMGKKFVVSFPHMHQLGTSMSTKLVHLGGATETVSEQNSFDFNNQGSTKVDATVQLGDLIVTRCGWKNPTDRIVPFGETTDSEMCFNFLAYYPAIPLYPWVTPSLNPACIPEITPNK